MTNRIIASVLFLLTGLSLLTGCPGGEVDAQAPELTLDVRSEETYVAGQDVVRITLTATDPQGQALEFEAVEVPARSTFQTFQNQAVFNWDPIISDVTDGDPHRLVFAVTNEAGRTTERSVLIHVDAGQAGTRFLNSSSQLYDPTSGAPLEFDVRVRNDQAPLVVINMPPDRAPEGASFEQTDDFEGRFYWMPTPVQREKRIHTVVFEADDEEEIVEQEVTIIIQDPDAGGTPGGGGGGGTVTECTGETGIAHQPLGAQRTAGNYAVEGQVTESSRNWVDAVLYWTFDDPLGGAPAYESKVLELDGSNGFAGEIPNPLLDPGGVEEISYTVCAFDDTGEDAGFICTPEEFLYRFLAYSPDDQKCRDDGQDLSSPSLADTISTSAWQAHRLCADGPKYHALDLASGEVVDLLVSFGAEEEPKVDITVDGSSVDVELLPCIGLAQATVEGPGQALVQVSADDFPYHITGFRDVADCPGAQYEPNNTPGQATLVVDDFVYFDDMAICTADDIDIFALELVRGDSFEAFLEFEHAQGDLDMTLFAPSQTSEILSGGFGVAQGWSTSDNETITYTAEESGFHYLSVVTSSEPNTYELLLERSCEVDDPYAGNHSTGTAASISTGGFSGLKLCEGQADYFEIDHLSSDDVIWVGEVRVVYGSANSVDVAVYDEQLDLVTTGEVVSGRIDFDFQPQPWSTYYLEIQSDRATVYDFDLVEF